MSGAATRVARGVQWLDDNHDGWRERIDWDRLDLDDLNDCILGQLLGGCAASGLTWNQLKTHGFWGLDAHEDYVALTQAWRDS